MKMIDSDTILFESTGKTCYINHGLIGIAPSGVYSCSGYDDDFYNAEDLTEQERTELADYMIKRWQAFKENRVIEQEF